MKALPTHEPRQLTTVPAAPPRSADACNRAETWMMVLLIVLVPTTGGALFYCHALGAQRSSLTRELAASRTMAREVVDELVVVRHELDLRESQVERLVDITTLSDDEIHRLRAAVSAWQRHNETLAQTAERKLSELAAQSAETERLLTEARQQHENERQQMEGDLYAARNQLSATSTELQQTQDYARETTVYNEQLQRGMWALRGSNHSLSQSLSSTESALSNAQSAASNAQSEADAAEAERNRARRALDRAGAVITSLKHEVAHERREEAREHNMGLVRPPQQTVVAPASRPEPSRPAPPPAESPRRDPPGGKGRR